MASSAVQTFNDYQQQAAATAIYPKDEALTYLALGVAGEAGEIANKVKKLIRDHIEARGPEREAHEDAIIAEMGDVLWYLAELASELGVPLDYVARTNLEKLAARQENGMLGGSGDNR